MRQEIRLWVPTPPSTNNLFRNNVSGGRVKTQEYQAWEKWAGMEIMAQRPGKIQGKVVLDFFHGNRSPIADCSNYIKALEDLLVSMGIIEGDSAKVVQRVSSCWVPNFTGSVVHINAWQDAAPAYLGFDAGVLGRVGASPLGAFVTSPQTLGKARRLKTGEAWTSPEGLTGRKRADARKKRL